MNRSLLSVLLLPALLFCTGCFSSTDKDERRPYTATQLQRMKRQDAMRTVDESKRDRQDLVNAFVGTIFSAIGDLIDLAKGRTHFDAAKAMIDPNSADARRRGIVHFSNRDWGRQGPYLKRYEQMARDDPNPSVRAMAIRALNRGRDKRAAPTFLLALGDKNEQIRLEGAKALANIPDESAVTPLIRHLESQEENLDLRIACADALRNYPSSEVAQVLVRALRDRNFAVSWQARKSLQIMTGQDYRYDTVAWLNYLSGANKPFG